MVGLVIVLSTVPSFAAVLRVRLMLGSNGSLGVFGSNGLVGTITTLALRLLLWQYVVKGVKLVARPFAARVPA